MLAQKAIRAAGTTSVRSDELCLEAASAYARLFRRSRAMEADAGGAQSYMSGCRALEARARARAWTVPPTTVERASALLRLVEGVSDEDVDEWIDLFPRAFLETIDRRLHSTGQSDPRRRRFIDRVPGAPAARPNLRT